MDRDFTEEHIVSKAYRLLEALIELGERLAMLVQAAGVNEAHASDFLRFSREEFEAEGIRNYPIIQKLARWHPWICMSRTSWVAAKRLMKSLFK